MRKFLRILSVILLVLWMGIIFFFSSQTAEESSQTSGAVIEVIAEKFYPDFEQMTEEKQQEIVASFQFVVRKATHIGTFAVLGFLAFLTFISYVNLRFFTRIFWATSISCIYAAGDEFHQRFVVGRSCELRDFLLDTAGILAAVLICSLFVKIIGPLRRKTAFAGVGKKKLININNELYEKLDGSLCRNKQLEDEVSDQKRIIEELKNELQYHVPIQPQQETPQENLKEILAENIETESEAEPMETEKREVELSEEIEYAAKVIGLAVVEVTKVCNKLGVSEQNETKKELMNLALGRNEVLKAQILDIVNSDVTFEEKKALMEKEKQQAFDYFDSIIAQMC